MTDRSRESLERVRYFDVVQEALKFDPVELAMLRAEGVMQTDRLGFEKFKRAYAWIYWKDLPVLITTDSLLHAIHQTYREMLMELERFILSPAWFKLLETVKVFLISRLGGLAETTDPALHHVYHDLILYLNVAWHAFGVNHFRIEPDDYPPGLEPPPIPDAVRLYIDPIEQLLRGKFGVPTPSIDFLTASFFNVKRDLDFHQFKPRGHYAEDLMMERYFCGMMWLQLVNFPLTKLDFSGEVQLCRESGAGFFLLLEAVERAEMQPTLDSIEYLLQAFVGQGDDFTISEFKAVCRQLNIQTAADWLACDETAALAALRDMFNQRPRIGGQTPKVPIAGGAPPICASLFGQRLTVESWIQHQLTFDRLNVDGKSVPRAYASPLDVMAVLGNERAETHLQFELQWFGYEGRLNELKNEVKGYPDAVWGDTFYQRWFAAIRSLNQSPDGLPPVMQTPAWADKLLHTQLASWSQLRHDNILYIKPSSSPAAVCDYPAGYVEPYPAFYAALREYAVLGTTVFQRLNEEKVLNHRLRSDFIDKCLAYFNHLSTVSSQLETIARKILACEAFDQEDTLFLRSVVVRKSVGNFAYGGGREEDWDGWYVGLFPFYDDQSPSLCSEVHANYEHRIAEPGVLYSGTGRVGVLAVVVDTAPATVYVGPAFTYYEHLKEGLDRLLDRDWQWMLKQPTAEHERRPQAPAWTISFRRNTNDFEMLDLPEKND